MQTEILISGFGGQGVLFAGQLLAYAAMDNGHHVTWIPSYGPEMRGGTAHCTVIISDDEIGSPLVRNPLGVIAMNMPSLDKYESLVASGGVLVVNSSLMTRKATRTDIRIIEIPANAIAEEFGNNKMANIVLLGALIAATGAMPLKDIEDALRNHLPERHRKLLEANFQALRKGAETLPMPTQDIYNYRKVNDHLITGGQPKEEQLKAAAEEGFKTVINLATMDPRYSLKDEAGLVHSLGMRYHPIPVDWENPLESDFESFEKIFKQVSADKTLVHCAANFRVTAFYSLYAMKNLGWSESQADEFRASIWKGSDYPVWEKFIGEMKKKIAGNV